MVGNEKKIEFPGSKSRPSAALRRLAAFTLIELLVVIGIIVLIASVSLPAIAKLLSGNNLVQGENLVSAYVTTAHALALKRHQEVALVFYYEGSGSAKANNGVIDAHQMAMQLAVPEPPGPNNGLMSQESGVGSNTVFVPYGGRHRVFLPVDVAVATLNNAGSTDNQTQPGAGEAYPPIPNPALCTAIVFDKNGHMIVRSGLYAEDTPALLGDYPAWYSDLDWNFGATSPGTNSAGNPSGVGGSSSPGVIVYSVTGLNDAVTNAGTGTAPATAAANYLQQNADTIIINSYTGSIIRQPKGQ